MMGDYVSGVLRADPLPSGVMGEDLTSRGAWSDTGACGTNAGTVVPIEAAAQLTGWPHNI